LAGALAGAALVGLAAVVNALWVLPAGGKSSFTFTDFGADVVFDLAHETGNVGIYYAEAGSSESTPIGFGEFSNGILSINDPAAVKASLESRGHELPWDTAIIRVNGKGERSALGISTRDDREREIIHAGAARGAADNAILAALDDYRRGSDGLRGGAGAAAAGYSDLLRIGKNRVTFQGKEVRAVRDLSHMDTPTLKAMVKRGFAGKTCELAQ
jgi:hypothetical protein